MKDLKKILSLIICSTMIISFRITSFADDKDVISVTFQSGDTITDICRAHGIDYYTYRSEIMRLNGIYDESWFNYVKVGQTILIPTGSSASSGSSQNSSGGDVVSVTVHNGDTIYDLCASQGIDYDQCKSTIMQLNGFTDPCRLNTIRDGESLLIPTNALPAAGSASVQANVNVDGETMSFTVKPGNTVAGICSVFGIDYERYKNIIMELNGITDERAFTRLKAGDTIVLPTVTYTEAVVPEQSTYNDGTSQRITVKNGNTVIGICEAYGIEYAANKAAIMELNGFTDEAAFSRLKVGDTLLLPISDASAQYSSSITTKETIERITVNDGETLKDICAAYGIDFNQYKSEIMKLNNINNPCKLNQIYEGETFLIPSRMITFSAAIEKTTPTIVSVVAEEGDTLKKMSERQGINFEEHKADIMQLNGITNSCKLHNIVKGESYLIPSYKTETTFEEKEMSTVTVTVEPGDTMKSIVERYGIDFNTYKPLIMQLNGITNSCKLNQLMVGETYVIPCFN